MSESAQWPQLPADEEVGIGFDLSAGQAAELARQIEIGYPELAELHAIATDFERAAREGVPFGYHYLPGCRIYWRKLARLGEWAMVHIDGWETSCSAVVPSPLPWHAEPTDTGTFGIGGGSLRNELLELRIVRREAEAMSTDSDASKRDVVDETTEQGERPGASSADAKNPGTFNGVDPVDYPYNDAAVADKLGVQPSTVSRWGTGRTKCPFNLLCTGEGKGRRWGKVGVDKAARMDGRDPTPEEIEARKPPRKDDR